MAFSEKAAGRRHRARPAVEAAASRSAMVRCRVPSGPVTRRAPVAKPSIEKSSPSDTATTWIGKARFDRAPESTPNRRERSERPRTDSSRAAPSWAKTVLRRARSPARETRPTPAAPRPMVTKSPGDAPTAMAQIAMAVASLRTSTVTTGIRITTIPITTAGTRVPTEGSTRGTAVTERPSTAARMSSSSVRPLRSGRVILTMYRRPRGIGLPALRIRRPAAMGSPPTSRNGRRRQRSRRSPS